MKPKEVTVVACVDLDRNRAKEFAARFGIRQHLDSLEAVDNADAVLIATPPATHPELVVSALRMGLPVFCEKPFVLNGEQFRDIERAIAAVGKPVHVGYVRRLYPSVMLARSLVEAGTVGDVVEVEAYEGQQFSWPVASDYVISSRSNAGGVLFDLGSHNLDAILFVLGLDTTYQYANPTAQVAVMESIVDSIRNESQAMGRVRITRRDGEVLVRYKFVRTGRLANIVRIRGTRAMVEVSTAFSMSANLVVNGRCFSIEEHDSYFYSRRSVADCCRHQLHEFVAAVNGDMICHSVQAWTRQYMTTRVLSAASDNRQTLGEM